MNKDGRQFGTSEQILFLFGTRKAVSPCTRCAKSYPMPYSQASQTRWFSRTMRDGIPPFRTAGAAASRATFKNSQATKKASAWGKRLLGPCLKVSVDRSNAHSIVGKPTMRSLLAE